jgi:hypothetical protein
VLIKRCLCEGMVIGEGVVRHWSDKRFAFCFPDLYRGNEACLN